MIGKIHNLNTGTLFACCDKKLINKTLNYNDLEIKISYNFYGEKIISKEELLKNICTCKQINIFGNKIANILIKEKIINKNQIIYIDNIAHIQIYNL
jgi:uncharacterized protein